ncbi:MAG: UvrD-helicase domain-containing protein, partial [Clostridia bacterium]|nr:UvrD-helicase domain-containing protein [Clostridia bacterium]
MTPNEFKVLRNAIIEKDFSRMNDMQFKAVTTADGPVLVLAGAGSGKTTVLVNRIAYLIKYGDAYDSYFVPTLDEYDIALAENFLKNGGEMPQTYTFSYKPAKPWEILAITFTNKAANELKERIAAKLGDETNGVWAGTFHSVCGKILRRYADRIGYSPNFTIYDSDDQKRLVKDIIRDNNLDEKIFTPKGVLSVISAQKEKLVTPAEYASGIGDDFRFKTIAKIYEAYESRLLAADAMDFDGMISNTVKLLNENEDVLDYYSSKFRYIMVDEYQDTNHSQYVLCKLLASRYKNICVVGDDDQSIYRFRGATIENILNFERQYKDAKVIKLEQNYRSVGNILDAANAVIANNQGRTGKNLWTDRGAGDKIKIYTALDDQSEARYVADTILENVRNGATFKDHAVLYRMNSQSRTIENAFARSGITYRVIGGHRFFDRKEIRDVMAYLQLINNNSDDMRLRRIINEPKRGIGDTTVNNAFQIASSLGVSIFEVLHNAEHYPLLSRATTRLLD